MKINGFKIASSNVVSLWLAITFIFSSMQLSAQNSQQQINISRATITVKSLLEEAERQSGFSFIYSNKFSGIDKTVTLSNTSGSLKDILADVSGKAQLRFEFTGNQITVREISRKESGQVRGQVMTVDSEPAAGAKVTLKGAGVSTLTDDNGIYILKAPAGSYMLELQYPGLPPLTQQINLTDGKLITADFSLYANSRQLQQFEVNANRSRFAKKESNNIAKLPIKNLENPQVYTTVSSELIKEQVITDIGNAIKNMPGIYKIQGNRGINTDGTSSYTIRGFRTEASMMDGVPGQTNGEIDPANIERIEVLKGPSATLYGSTLTSFGGLINIVSKKPMEAFGGEVSYTAGSFNLNRITADVHGPVSKDSSLLFRVNTAYQNTSSWQDAGFRKSMFIAPALHYRAGDRLNIFLNAEFYQTESTNPSSIFLNRVRPFIAQSPDELNFDWKRSYTSSDITMKNPTMNARAQVLYKISDQWTSQTIISTNTRKSDGYYQYQFIRKAASEDSLERTVSLQNTSNTAIDIQQNFTGDFRIGTLRNRLVVGFDYVNMRVSNDNSPYIAFDFVDGSLAADPNYVKISRYALDARLNSSTLAPTRNHGSSEIFSVYASDVINVTDRLLAMMSVRLDKFSSKGTINHATNQPIVNSKFDKSAVSPKFGLVYQVVKEQISLFANYMNGFAYVQPVTQSLPGLSGAMKPQQANQFEGGVKLDLFRSKLSFTASYYDITVDNMTRQESITVEGTRYDITVQNGTQDSRGIEFELIANPLPGLNLLAGYAYNDSKLVKAASNVEGRRPPSAGPANLANAWISYTQPRGKVKGLGVGIGGNYVGEHLTSNTTVTGIFTLPSYTILNATVFYDTKRFRLGVKADNLTDQLYFAGQGVLTPQLPFNMNANVTVKF
ncbi:TonB-dependent receptor [Chitinophaga horti]|uniref:TonB-dependent receptor n=1 Tax=Chitinophaga horti TaxID=2920382 RepID=A0ABY6J605_9BACT|nr:TonB-dependent receptor [Chitinophaga horti]UYQ95120.1 TonB-dependent receptor [Chitinophaga horti]